MRVYNKLVRDRIPELMEAQGKHPVVQTLCDADYTKHLEAKLDEEVSEYHQDKNLEELADILEVVLALAENLGASKEELLAAYQEKHEARGGFAQKRFLISD